jgi:hypothetical protein
MRHRHATRLLALGLAITIAPVAMSAPQDLTQLAAPDLGASPPAAQNIQEFDVSVAGMGHAGSALDSTLVDLMTADFSSPLGEYELLTKLYGQRHFSSYLAVRHLDHRDNEFVVHVQQGRAPEEPDWLARVQHFVGFEHPRVVPILDVGAIDGRGFVATPFVEGRHLVHAWARAEVLFPLEISTHVVNELCRTLVEAPQLVRRLGFTPVARSDVMVSSNGEIKLDIGAACLRRRAAQGTPHLKMLLSPEETRGREPDERSSVYSLGILLWEFLTGQMLFPIYGRYIPRRIERDADFGKRPLFGVVPPSYLKNRVPNELDYVCARALKTNPNRRYGSCAELEAELSRYLALRGWRDGQARMAEFMTQWFGSDFAFERDYRTALSLQKPRPPSA